jgi:hypothetical protein
MEFLDKNLIGIVLDFLHDPKEINKCTLLNKHWYNVIKNYYYKNKLNVLLWKNYNPLLDKRLPGLKLTWHLAYIFRKEYEDRFKIKCEICRKEIRNFKTCTVCGRRVGKNCLRKTGCCYNLFCIRCNEVDACNCTINDYDFISNG